jgi:UDP-N-acetylglucosamine enolpyruvyl transferase
MHQLPGCRSAVEAVREPPLRAPDLRAGAALVNAAA